MFRLERKSGTPQQARQKGVLSEMGMLRQLSGHRIEKRDCLPQAAPLFDVPIKSVQSGKIDRGLILSKLTGVMSADDE